MKTIFSIIMLLAAVALFAQDTITKQNPLTPNAIAITPQKNKDSHTTPIIYNYRYQTLYRGVDNHLSIIIPKGATSCTFSAPGLTRAGHDYVDITIPKDYTQNGLTLECTVVTKKETHTYTYHYVIKNIEIRMLINGQGCEKCIVQQTLTELDNAPISVQMADLEPFTYASVKSFVVTLPNGDTIKVHGDRINHEAHFFIEQFTKPGDIITIDNIRFYVPANGDSWYTGPRTVKIMLVE